MLKNERGEVVANINRTVFGTQLQICQNRHSPYEYLPNTTLNEKFDIQPGIYPVQPEGSKQNVYPSLNYWAIGRGGHRNVNGPDNEPLNEALAHNPTDAALFKHIPFVLRPLDNDLTAEERAKYALRRIETHAGVKHVAYYLKRLPKSTAAPKLLRVVIENGVETVTDWVPSAADLSPTPELPNHNRVTKVSGEYITTSESVRVGLTKQEIDEIVNACVIIYGKSNYAAISEVALVHATDSVVPTSDHLGNSFNYNEVIGAQCNTFYCAEPDNLRSAEVFQLVFDVGVSDALGIKG